MGMQPPRALLGDPSSSLSLPPGDGGGHAARRGASAPFLYSATPQSPSQQLPRGWAKGQGSVLASPLGRAAAGTRRGRAQPWEADHGGEEELHRGEGWWGAAGHTATGRVWLYRHGPEVRAGGWVRGCACVEGLYPPTPAVMAPCAQLSLFGSVVGSGLQWGQLPCPLSTCSPCPTPKPSSQLMPKPELAAAGREAGTGSAKHVRTAASVHASVQG